MRTTFSADFINLFIYLGAQVKSQSIDKQR